MKTNIDRVFDHFYYGKWLYKKTDKIRLADDGCTIERLGTPIAKIIGTEVDGVYDELLVVTLQKFKSDKQWEISKKRLITFARKVFGIPTIFIPHLDVGFGEYKESYPNIRLHSLTETLIKVAKFSTDDIKTAVGAIRKDNEGEEIVAYSFNQCIDGEYQHAEAILIKYCNMLNLIVYSFYSLLEPCDNCLQKMINVGAQCIEYSYCHKDKWNNDNYIQLVNDIQSHTLLNNDKPIIYRKLISTQVNKFYNNLKGDGK